jgi:ABC-2 type transport system ATP-binding protein
LLLTTTISINELSKFFGETKAVNGVSLDVQRGEVFGFLGPNAAGKSTTVKVAATLLSPTKGTIVVDGYDVQSNPVEVRSTVGLLPEDGATTHYDRMSAFKNLEYFGRLYDVPDEKLQDRILQLLEFLELADRAHDSPATYSTGLKQKLSLARSMIHDPNVVFLDEPTSNLDPIMSQKIRQFIDQQAESGKQTFFLCTHLLSEFEHLCDRVGFISNGKLVEVGSPRELRQKFWKIQTFEIRLSEADLSSVQDIIKSTGLSLEIRIEGNLVVFEIENAEQGNPKILKALVESKMNVVEVRERVPALEAVYRKVIGGY